MPHPRVRPTNIRNGLIRVLIREIQIEALQSAPISKLYGSIINYSTFSPDETLILSSVILSLLDVPISRISARQTGQ